MADLSLGLNETEQLDSDSSVVADEQLALRGELFLIDGATRRADRRRREVAANRDSTYRRLLGSADVIAATAAVAVTWFVTGQEMFVWATLAAALVTVPAAKLMGLYDRDANLLNRTTLDEFPRLANLALLVAVVASAARNVAIAGPSEFGVPVFGILTILLAVSFTVGRVSARRLARAVTPTERLLAVGSAEDTDDLIRRIGHSPSIKAEVVGRIPIAWNELPDGRSQVLGETRDLRRVVTAHSVDRLVVMPGRRDPEEVADVVRAVKSVGVKISLLPRLFDAVGFAIEPDDVGGLQMMGVRDFRMTASSSLIKRATDILGAGVALALASPLFVLSAIAIKLDSKGPVFYRQSRIGRRGESFSIIKFRTMRVGADSERESLRHMNETSGLFKIAEDPRVTRVGRLLRKSSVDELPQLLNVLRGDMSLVGPRPLVPSEDEAITGWYRRRSHITPGITGVWQLHGPVRIPLDEMVKMDYLYVANWSWWGDVKILLRTVLHVAGRRGL